VYAKNEEWDVGTYTLKFVGVDDVGNENRDCVAVINVADTTPPRIFACPPATVTQAVDTGVATFTAAATLSHFLNSISSADNKGVVTRVTDPSLTTPLAVGAAGHVVTYTATDAAGNAAVCTFTLVVVDTEWPSISCLAAGPPPSKVVSSVSYGDGSWSYTVAFQSELTGTYISGWSDAVATDNAPAFVLTSNARRLSDDVAVAATDALSAGEYRMFYSVTDAAGNGARTCEFSLVVVDTFAPTVSCAAGLLTPAQPRSALETSNYWLGDFDVDAVGAATDNIGVVSTSVTVGGVNAQGYRFNADAGGGDAMYTIVYTVADAAGLQASCSFDISVRDATPPQPLDCDGGVMPSRVAATDVDAATYTGGWVEPEFKDNVAVQTITAILSNASTGVTTTVPQMTGFSLQLGVNTITYTATDAVGNQATCAVSIQVGCSHTRFCQSLLSLVFAFATKHSLFIPSFLTLPYLALPGGGHATSSSHGGRRSLLDVVYAGTRRRRRHVVQRTMDACGGSRLR
jgi:hypothetical protein